MNQPMTCPECGQECQGYRGLSRHLLKAHNVREPILITVACAYCGAPKELHPSVAAKSAKRFCDRKCYGLYRAANSTGEASPSWKERVSVCCDWCGKRMELEPYQAERSEHHFCCHNPCYALWLSENKHSDAAARWKDGRSPRRRVARFRRVVKERDAAKCQWCGSSRNVVAHHIIPLTERPDLSRDAANGITLCKSCHAKAHQTARAARAAGCDGWTPTRGAVIQ